MMVTKTSRRTASAASTASKPKTTKPKTTTKSATTRRTSAVEPKLVEVKEAVVAQPALRKKELIDLVVERTGGKKKDAKPAIEAMLSILGEALADGRELNLRPFGKLKVTRQTEKSNGTVISCRVRQPKDRSAPTPSPSDSQD